MIFSLVDVIRRAIKSDELEDDSDCQLQLQESNVTAQVSD